jgi:hypothetical protein
MRSEPDAGCHGCSRYERLLKEIQEALEKGRKLSAEDVKTATEKTWDWKGRESYLPPEKTE